MTYLNVAYTALMKGRNTDHFWGRKQSTDALADKVPRAVDDVVDALVPDSYDDRQAAAMVEQYLTLWQSSAVEPFLKDVDPKNTYSASLLDEFEEDELKLFNPSQIMYRVEQAPPKFDGYPSLGEIYSNEIYWVDRLAAVVIYAVVERLKT